MPPEGLVTVASYTTSAEAHLSRARLLHEGIEAILLNENLVVQDWLVSSAIGGVQLKVRASEAAQAHEILTRAPYAAGLALAPDPRCPRCDSREVHLAHHGRWLALAWFFVFGLPLPLVRRRWHCRACGASWKFRHDRSDRDADRAGPSGGAPEWALPAEPGALFEAHEPWVWRAPLLVLALIPGAAVLILSPRYSAAVLLLAAFLVAGLLALVATVAPPRTRRARLSAAGLAIEDGDARLVYPWENLAVRKLPDGTPGVMLGARVLATELAPQNRFGADIQLRASDLAELADWIRELQGGPPSITRAET